MFSIRPSPHKATANRPTYQHLLPVLWRHGHRPETFQPARELHVPCLAAKFHLTARQEHVVNQSGQYWPGDHLVEPLYRRLGDNTNRNTEPTSHQCQKIPLNCFVPRGRFSGITWQVCNWGSIGFTGRALCFSGSHVTSCQATWLDGVMACNTGQIFSEQVANNNLMGYIS